MSRKHRKKRKDTPAPDPERHEPSPTVAPTLTPEQRRDAGSLRLGEIHKLWAQNGTAIMVGAGVALLTTAVANPVGRLLLVLVLLGGVYGVVAPFAGLPLPEPKAETKHTWRIAFVVVIVGVVGGVFFSTPTGAEFRAWVRSRLPSKAMAPPPPLTTRWPPEIAYGSISGKQRVVVAIGLANTTNAELLISIQSKAVLRPVARTDDEQKAELRNLSDEMHRQPPGRAVVVRVPAHDSSVRFLVSGPEVSQAHWGDLVAGREYVYFYALMKVQLRPAFSGHSTGIGTYPTVACGVGTGNEVLECPGDLKHP